VLNFEENKNFCEMLRNNLPRDSFFFTENSVFSSIEILGRQKKKLYSSIPIDGEKCDTLPYNFFPNR
jgi:hypothetical protein